MSDDNKFSWFFLGLGLGAAVGLLFAPKSGEETRQMLASKAGEGKDYLKRQSDTIKDTANDAIERGRSALARQREQLNQAVEAGKQAYRDAVSAGEAEEPADQNA
jgi:gas vesicle protein